MKLAIMQPYFFPYLGYYQLVNSVDEFVFFDDVNFIKKGYIHRNTICSQQAPLNFTLPVENISQHRKINAHCYIQDFKKFKNMVFFSYKKSPYFEKIFPRIENILATTDANVATLNAQTITTVYDYLGLEKKFSFASSLAIPEEKKGQDRILALCQQRACTAYHNPIGAKTLNLYDSASFATVGIALKFIQKHHADTAPILANNFSMIDILMNHPPKEITRYLAAYDLIS